MGDQATVEQLLIERELQTVKELRAEIERLRAALRQIELNSRDGAPLMAKLNWVARTALGDA